MRQLVVLAALCLAPLVAEAGDIPWFDKAATEQLVRAVEPAWFAHLQVQFADRPDKYNSHLHKAMVIIATRDEQPAVYRAWSRVCAAEMAYVDAHRAYRDGSASAQAAIAPTLGPLATEWEEAIAGLYAVKIPVVQERLYHLEANLSDLQANFDAYVADRVLNTTRK